MDQWTDRQVYVKKARFMDRQIHGRTDGQTDFRTIRWTDG